MDRLGMLNCRSCTPWGRPDSHYTQNGVNTCSGKYFTNFSLSKSHAKGTGVVTDCLAWNGCRVGGATTTPHGAAGWK